MQKTQESRFLEVLCPRCKNRKVLFGKSSTLIKCEKCNYLLLKTSGGKAIIKGGIKKVL